MRKKRAFISADNRGTLIPSSRCPFAPKGNPRGRTAANKSPKGFAQSALRPAEESRDRVAPCGRQPDKHDLYRIHSEFGDYIGVTKNTVARFSEHCRSKTPIGDVIRFCQRENITFQVLVVGTPQYIYEAEIAAIQAFSTLWPWGFNLAVGGALARNGKTIQRMAAAKRGKPLSENFRKGAVAASRRRVLSPTRKAELSAASQHPLVRARASVTLLDHAVSTEARQKISAAFKGKPLRQEHCAKISRSLSGRTLSASHKAALSRAARAARARL